ncbi:multicopper oxidase family protein [Acidisoma sp. S159]|uniref:multicopper oxidase family protein n=1 Tax=Acidisoma sp. S159 TaxID=1747225 RepID=UPI00131D1C49|nr:multicopper oxidase family protein [Acidisoma sp. S159]
MPSRRSILLGALAAAGSLPTGAMAQPSAATTVLRVERRTIEVNRRPAVVLGIRQPDGTFGLTTAAGTSFRVRLENHLDEPTLIHWHGMTPPWRQDGVPGISGPPIRAGESGEFDFPLRFGGTFWMHSHEGLQEQLLAAAPLIIKDARDQTDQQEIVVMLADFSFTPPAQIFADLRKKQGMVNMAPATPGMAGMDSSGTPAANALDLNDVKYDAFLANDRTLEDPEVVTVEPGGRILLRIINSSAMSAYHIDTGALVGSLVAVDGFAIQPVTGRRFPIAVAQRLDIRLQLPKGSHIYPLLAVLEGDRRRTGIVLAAGNAAITRVSNMASKSSTPLNLNLEHRLRAAAPLSVRKADRTHLINLTGEMAGYIWSINNVVWNPRVPPLSVVEGERVELVLQNQTGMSHPMHLHGHEFQVVEIDGVRLSGAVRDTVLVPPNSRVTVAFDANNPGHWAFHCHLLYHLDAGMFITLRYI